MSRKPRAGAHRRLRVVLDTNVVLSALVFGKGVTARLRTAWQQDSFVPLASTETVRELMRVLRYPKFRLEAAEQQELLADYLPWIEVVRVPSPPPPVPECRDPFDLPFLQLAAAANADMLMTGDADLLALARRMRCRILPPAEFLQVLEARVGRGISPG